MGNFWQISLLPPPPPGMAQVWIVIFVLKINFCLKTLSKYTHSTIIGVKVCNRQADELFDTIHSQVSRRVTARGSCTGLVTVVYMLISDSLDLA